MRVVWVDPYKERNVAGEAPVIGICAAGGGITIVAERIAAILASKT